jgi:transcriptional regulator with XRE-family HTH domain
LHLGLSQTQLAEGIISQAQISNIEKGRIIPLCTTLFQIANKLGVDVNYFYDHAYNYRNDYLSEVKFQVRKAIRNRDYEMVERLIKAEKNNPIFKIAHNKQFLLWHQGIIEFYNNQDFKKSISILNEALNLEINLNVFNHRIQKIEILTSIAIIHNEIGQYKESIQIYEKAFSKLIDLIDVRDPKLEIRLCYGIAKSLYRRESFSQTINYCNRGIKQCLKNETLYLLGELYYHAGLTYDKQNKFSEAESLYNKAKYLFEIENKELFLETVLNKIKKINEKKV